MKARMFLIHVGLGLLFFFGGLSQLCADITVRLSVKFILMPDGTRPAPGNIGTTDGFNAQIEAGNAVLAATGRGLRLQVTYEDIQPPVPAGQGDNYWYDLNARADGSIQLIESAAFATEATEATWKWNRNAINVYVNNSSSGQCSFPGDGGGYTILLGQDVASSRTVLHEVGHFFGLRHTHAGDLNCANPPPYTLEDGDGLSATVPDHNCYTTRAALIAALPPELQAAVDTSWLNVMSYHAPRTLLLDQQMDYVWAFWAYSVRNYVTSGRLWYVSAFGNDTFGGWYGGIPLATIGRALASVTGPDDVILLTRSGTFFAPPGNVIATPCTLRATDGPVTILHAP